MNWTRKPNDLDRERTYRFSGPGKITQAAQAIVSPVEQIAIVEMLREEAKRLDGLDYRQTFTNNNGDTIICVDALDDSLRPRYYAEGMGYCDYFTIMLPMEQ